MNANFLVSGSNVFYLRGTLGERVPATAVGLLSFPECVAISYERSDHTQLYYDCPVERLTFALLTRSPPLPNVVRPHRLPLLSGPEQLQPMFRIVLGLRASTLRCRMTANIFKLHLSFHKTRWADAFSSQKVVPHIGK